MIYNESIDDYPDKEIILIQPYINDMPEFAKTISYALERGLKVTIITSKLRDQVCYRPLQNNDPFVIGRFIYHPNVTVLETNADRFLHTKVFISKNHGILIGSCNFDVWSMYVNDEANLYIGDRNVANKIMYELNGQIKNLKIVNKSRSGLNILKELRVGFWKIFLNVSYVYMKFRKSDHELV